MLLGFHLSDWPIIMDVKSLGFLLLVMKYSFGQMSPPPTPLMPMTATIPLPTFTHQELVMGFDSFIGDWPWQVLIEFDGGQICGGVLLSNDWILSAAHCFSGKSASNVILGGHRRDGSGPNAVKQTVKRTCCHDGYDHVTSANDICLVQLSEPVNYNTYIKNATLPEPNTEVADDSLCVVTGWGLTEDGQPAELLQEGNVYTINRQRCVDWYKKDGVNIPADHFCAGHDQGGTDTCGGDSGGPLVCMQNTQGHVLRGITSFGPENCGIAERPGVYTKVSSYIEWINTKMSSPCVDYSWGSWNEVCSSTCGQGLKVKTRECLKDNTEVVPSSNCQGSARQTGFCFTKCKADGPVFHWGEWKKSCSTTCGDGVEARIRECLDDKNKPVSDVKKCSPGSNIGHGSCNLGPCSEYRWGDWIATCSVTCGEGVETRRRSCLDGNNKVVPKRHCGDGDDVKTRKCIRADCSVYRWGPWKTECSVTCGKGTETRTRDCLDQNNRPVAPSTRCSPGKDRTRGVCYKEDCVVYRWGPWKTQCSVTCGRGTETRTRNCLDQKDRPVAANRCVPGSNREQGICQMDDCDEYHWSSWTSSCSVTCGKGSGTRRRSCLDHKNKVVSKRNCGTGDDVQSGQCSRPACEAYTWSPWKRVCSVTCGTGVEIRTRECWDQNHRRVFPTSRCGPGISEERGLCEMECKHYHWGPWTTTCSVTCGKGIDIMTRSCLDYTDNVVHKSHCRAGDDVKMGTCFREDCVAEVSYHWSSWKKTECSAPCGIGTVTKTRDCLDSANRVVFPTSKCGSGRNYDEEACIMKDCEDYNWGPWQGTCSQTCGAGIEKRTRHCLNNNNQAVYPSSKCHPGSDQQKRKCYLEKCKPSNSYSWGSWDSWTSCRVGFSSEDPCNGSQYSYRSCKQRYRTVSITFCKNIDYNGGGDDVRSRPCIPSRCSGYIPNYHDDNDNFPDFFKFTI